MARTLIIPDIHENIPRLLKLEDRIAKADHVVCVGDYFDCFGPEKWDQMIEWILDRINDEKFTFLCGNHDVSYFFDHHWFMCSGFKLHKRDPIRRALLQYVGDKILLETRVGPYCVSHAGWHASTLKFRKPEVIQEAFDLAKRGEFHPIWGAGLTRGGNQLIGGVVWQDWNYEFEDIVEFKQIVGHTAGFDIKTKGSSYCIDTSLQKVAWFDDLDGRLTFENTELELNNSDV